MTLQRTFDEVYRENRWNGIESLSGPGSGPVATTRVIPALLDLVGRHAVASVLDVGCGDGYWMPDLPGVLYAGIDVSREAVRRARARHPDRTYTVGDLTTTTFVSGADLVFCRDVLQHLSYGDGTALVAAMRSVARRWLLLSTYRRPSNPVRDIASGACFEPDLSLPPYGLGEPVELIPDGYTYHDPDAIRDPSKYLGLWRAGAA